MNTLTLAEFWPLCLRRLHQMLTPQQFDTWIAPLTVGEENDVWVVYGKNQFASNMLQNQFAAKFETVLKELAPEQPALQFKAGRGISYPMAPDENTDTVQKTTSAQERPSESPTTEMAEPAKSPAKSKQSAQDILAERLKNLPAKSAEEQQEHKSEAAKTTPGRTEEQRDAHYAHTNLSPDYTFATLVEGKGNRMAAAAAKSIAENPGDRYNPFFLYGSTGLGKTHLVQAIGNDLLQHNPKAKVRYMHADEYIRGLMNAFRTNNYDTFKQQYKQYDLLIIDDIQFIKGKDRTMEEFFYLYNHFHAEKKQLILTCDVLPAKIEDMDDRLKSRFSWGLTLELEPPEFEMRVAILQKKAESAGVTLREDAAFFIAKHIRSNVRELEGAFKRVEASSRFQKKPIDIDLATEALQDIVASAYKVITAELILDAVAKHYRVKISELLGKKRTRTIARPRQVAMSLTKDLTSLSLPAIGEAFGGRDHTTVMHGIKAVAKLRQEDPEVAQDYEKLLLLIQN